MTLRNGEQRNELMCSHRHSEATACLVLEGQILSQSFFYGKHFGPWGNVTEFVQDFQAVQI